MASTNHLVFSLVEFLKDQMATGELSDEKLESLEVAIECLERVYGIDTQDTKCADKYKISVPLTELFEAALRKEGISIDKNETNIDFNIPNSVETTEEERQKAAEWKMKGNDFMKDEKFEEALDCYNKAVDLDCRNAVYYCNRAASLIKIKRYHEAREDCQRALSIDPSYSRAYARMGVAHTELGEHSDARECYRKAVELEPDNESYRANLQAAEAALRSESANVASGPMGGIDFTSLLSNPNIMNMATQMFSNPNFQSMVSSMMSGATSNSAPDMSTIMSMGHQMANQMREANPELVEQLRQFNTSNSNQNSQPPDQSQ